MSVAQPGIHVKVTLMEAFVVATDSTRGGHQELRFQTRGSHSVLHEYLRLIRSAQRARDGFFSQPFPGSLTTDPVVATTHGSP